MMICHYTWKVSFRAGSEALKKPYKVPASAPSDNYFLSMSDCNINSVQNCLFFCISLPVEVV